MGGGDLVKVTLQALELVFHVFFQWRSDFEMVTSDIAKEVSKEL